MQLPASHRPTERPHRLNLFRHVYPPSARSNEVLRPANQDTSGADRPTMRRMTRKALAARRQFAGSSFGSPTVLRESWRRIRSSKPWSISRSPQLMADTNLCRNVLNDIGAPPAEVFVLVAALEARVPQTLLEHSATNDLSVVEPRLVTELNQRGIERAGPNGPSTPGKRSSAARRWARKR